MLIDPDLADFLEGDVALYVGTADADGVPMAGRGWGLLIDREAGRARLIVGANVGTVANLRTTRRVALVASDMTYRSVQLKGAATIETFSPADELLREEYRMKFHAAIAAFGNDPAFINWPAACEAVSIEFDAIFDQTPGPNAGAHLGNAPT